MQQYAWPGNVRELHGAIKEAMLRATGHLILAEFLPDAVRHPQAAPPADSGGGAALADVHALVKDLLDRGEKDVYTQVVRAVERVLLSQVLRRTNYHQGQASEVLGLNRSTLRYKLRELGISLGKAIAEDAPKIKLRELNLSNTLVTDAGVMWRWAGGQPKRPYALHTIGSLTRLARVLDHAFGRQEPSERFAPMPRGSHGTSGRSRLGTAGLHSSATSTRHGSVRRDPLMNRALSSSRATADQSSRRFCGFCGEAVPWLKDRERWASYNSGVQHLSGDPCLPTLRVVQRTAPPDSAVPRRQWACLNATRSNRRLTSVSSKPAPSRCCAAISSNGMKESW